MWSRLRLALLLALTGCVSRTLVIESEPPGATIVLNREPVEGVVEPAEIPFDHSGVHQGRLEREEPRPLAATADVDAPWWAWPPFDLFADLLWPFPIEDRRRFTYRLEPRPPEPRSEEEWLELEEELRRRSAEVLERAKDLRRRVNEGDPAEAR